MRHATKQAIKNNEKVSSQEAKEGETVSHPVRETHTHIASHRVGKLHFDLHEGCCNSIHLDDDLLALYEMTSIFAAEWRPWRRELSQHSDKVRGP